MRIPGASFQTRTTIDRGVQRSREFERIRALPRRILDLKNAPDLTERFRRPGSTWRLRPIQSWALFEAEKMQGLFGAIGVGFGKTLIDLLLPEMLDSRSTVLFVPPQLRDQLVHVDVPRYAEHFRIRNDVLHVVAYSELSSAKRAGILDELSPDLIIADEAHNLRHKDAARTKRFARYMKENPMTRFCALSGTITAKSLRDYAHLIEYALRKNSPVPNGWHELSDWSDALDVAPINAIGPGVLLQFCAEGETPREGFGRRLVESPGVVATSESELGVSLIISKRDISLPDKIAKKIKDIRSTWAVDDEEFDEALALYRILRQVACGFYYKWDWPNGQKDHEWIEARAAWNREVRTYLAHSSRPGLDSPGLLEAAAREGRWKSDAWAAWEAVKERPAPPVKPVWISDFLVRDAIRWANEMCFDETPEPGIIWYEHDALGEAIADLGKFPLFGPGSSKAILNTREPVIVCSIHAHSEGKNLQYYRHNLITTPPANGIDWEQTMGRTHRSGQEADEVTVDVYVHTDELREAFDLALRSAEYIEETTRQKQRLLYATKVGL